MKVCVVGVLSEIRIRRQSSQPPLDTAAMLAKIVLGNVGEWWEVSKKICSFVLSQGRSDLRLSQSAWFTLMKCGAQSRVGPRYRTHRLLPRLEAHVHRCVRGFT